MTPTNFEKVNDKINAQLPTEEVNIKGKKLHEVWAIARPIFLLLVAMPILPAKWKSVLSTLSATLDMVDQG